MLAAEHAESAPHYSLVKRAGEVLQRATGSCDLSRKLGH